MAQWFHSVDRGMRGGMSQRPMLKVSGDFKQQRVVLITKCSSSVYTGAGEVVSQPLAESRSEKLRWPECGQCGLPYGSGPYRRRVVFLIGVGRQVRPCDRPLPGTVSETRQLTWWRSNRSLRLWSINPTCLCGAGAFCVGRCGLTGYSKINSL